MGLVFRLVLQILLIPLALVLAALGIRSPGSGLLRFYRPPGTGSPYRRR